MVNETNDPVWRQRFEASTPELRRIMLAIVRAEGEIANLRSQSASVGELLPHIRRLHDLQDRESELLAQSRLHGRQCGAADYRPTRPTVMP